MSYAKLFKFCLSFLLVLGTLISCKIDDNGLGISNTFEEIEEEIVIVYTIKAYSFDSQNANLMFQDGEAQEIMTSNERRYAIANTLSIKAIDEFTFEVANYSPVDIKSATIFAKIDGVD